MRNKCTKEKPMPKDAPGQWEHDGAECYDDTDDKDYFRCVDCGITWVKYYEH